MSQSDIYTVICIVMGEDVPFPIKIEKSKVVGLLKDSIKEERRDIFANIDSNFLDLYHVEFADDDDLVTNVKTHAFVSPLRATARLSSLFPDTPKGRTIHFIVKPRRKRPASRELDREKRPNPSQIPQRSPPVALVHDFTARRDSTVSALYERLNHYHFVLVRGTPGSGKSTLAELLAHHIRAKEPGVDPIVINSWPDNRLNWLEKLTEKYNRKGPNVVIIDRAQQTYWDNGFWNAYLKSISTDHPDRVILFVSYGKPEGGVSVQGTSTVVPGRWRVSLRPVDHRDGIAPAGLFLTEDEFTDLVHKLSPAGHFKKDFLNYVFHVTTGHIGAVCDLLSVVLADRSYRDLKHEDGEYSLDIFHSRFPVEELWRRLESTTIFRRGLPLSEEIQNPGVARVFRAVLSNSRVTKKMLNSTEDVAALDLCFKRGLLHATVDQYETNYIFTTPLHQWFVEYYLGTQVPNPTPILDQNLLIFVINVVKLFSPLQLSSARTVGTSDTQRPPEARLQDEFYRCCHQYSNGFVISFPEFGYTSGKIDLYIPLKRWGVELLRDGDGLENHSSRFIGPGAYAQMEFSDYIILDFRIERPQKPYPGIPKLYHVVFGDKYNHVDILDGFSLNPIPDVESGFALLNH